MRKVVYIVDQLSYVLCGQKIKTLANVIKWLGIVLGCVAFITGVIMVFTDLAWLSSLMILGGLAVVLLGWINGLLLYGFGIIVDANENKTLATGSVSRADLPVASAPRATVPKAPVAAAPEKKVEKPIERPVEQPAPVERPLPVTRAKVEAPSTPWEKVAYALRFSTNDGMVGYLQKCALEEPVRSEIDACLHAADIRAALKAWLDTHQ